MSGKFRICLPTIISVFLAGVAHADGPDGSGKGSLMVNGYQFKDFGVAEIEGLRSKAVADQFFLQDSFARAVKHYEQAARKLPNEADIYLRLGDIYNYLDVQNLALTYYRMAAEKYMLPENSGKPGGNRYLARIRLARKYEETRAINDGHDRAREIIAELRPSSEQDMKKNYPEVYSEYLNVTAYVTGNVIVPLTN